MVFSFTLITSAIFASGGQSFYPFAFINPAELSQVKHWKVSVGYYAAFVRNKFQGSVTIPTGLSFPTFRAVTQTFSGIARSSDVSHLPGGQIAYRINDRFVVGLRYSEPYDSTISFADTFGRFANNKSSTRVNDISPEFAFSFSPKFSIGAGLDIMHLFAEANINTIPFLIPFSPLSVNEGLSKNHASGWGLGWHIGMLINPWLGNYLGLTYYSRSRYTLHGVTQFNGSFLDGTPIFIKNGIVVPQARPDTFIFSDFQALSEKFGLFLHLTYTLWSILQSITVENVAVPNPPYDSNTFTIDFKYRNAWRIGFGGRYAPSENWIFFLGTTFDQTPVPSPQYRGLFFPETNGIHLWASLTRKFTKHFSTSLMYSHSFYQKRAVDNSFAGVTSLGVNRPVVDFIGLDLTYES